LSSTNPRKLGWPVFLVLRVTTVTRFASPSVVLRCKCRSPPPWLKKRRPGSRPALRDAQLRISPSVPAPSAAISPPWRRRGQRTTPTKLPPEGLRCAARRAARSRSLARRCRPGAGAFRAGKQRRIRALAAAILRRAGLAASSVRHSSRDGTRGCRRGSGTNQPE